MTKTISKTILSGLITLTAICNYATAQTDEPKLYSQEYYKVDNNGKDTLYRKNVFDYNSNGTRKLYTEYRGNGNGYIPEYKNVHIGNGLDTTDIIYHKGNINDETILIPESKTISSYDENGNLIKKKNMNKIQTTI